MHFALLSGQMLIGYSAHTPFFVARSDYVQRSVAASVFTPTTHATGPAALGHKGSAGRFMRGYSDIGSTTASGYTMLDVVRVLAPIQIFSVTA